MLVITRKSNESFYIGEDIKVTILSNTGNSVKIGIDAPASTLILREELTHAEADDHDLLTIPEQNPTIVVKKRRRIGLFSALLPQ